MLFTSISNWLKQYVWPARLRGAPGEASAPQLNIPGLPEGLGVLSRAAGQAVLVREQRLGVQLAQQCAMSLLPGAALLSSQDVQAHSKRIAWLLKSAVPDNRLLRTYILTEQVYEVVCTEGMASLFEELQASALSSQHALLVLGAEKLFNWQNLAQMNQQARQWQAWIEQRPAPVILFFFDQGGIHSMLSDLLGLNGLFPNLAVLDQDGERAILTLERWQHGSTRVDERQFGLVARSDGMLIADGSQTNVRDQTLLMAPDQEQVLATREAVEGEHGVPKHWQIAQDFAELESLSETAIAATLLIHGGRKNQFDQLARLVQQLRRRHPRALKIVVREVGSKLRYNDELVLLRLGANLILYQELPFSRLLQTLAELRQQTFTRELESDYDATLLAAEPNRVSGYQKPTQFILSVREMVERTGRLNLENCLVKLPLLPRTAQANVIKSCVTKRDGDLYTVDKNNAYLFLFACREPDVTATLERVFKIAVSDLFSSYTVYPKSGLILNLLEQLHQADERGELPDFSAVLQELDSNSHVVGKVEQHWAAVAPARPELVQHDIDSAETDATGSDDDGIRRIVRRPLKLRDAGLLTNEQ